MSSHIKTFSFLMILLSLLSVGCSHDSGSAPSGGGAPAKKDFGAIELRLNTIKTRLAEYEQCLATKGFSLCDDIAAQLNLL